MTKCIHGHEGAVIKGPRAVAKGCIHCAAETLREELVEILKPKRVGEPS
jgi:hypothetical protein